MPWTVERVLTWTRGFFERKGIDSPRLSAELLMSHVLKIPRIRLYTDYQRPLADAELIRMRELVKRAGEDEPIAYLTGVAHFFNLEFAVTRDTLIPRPDTETLVEQVLSLFRHSTGFAAPRVLDLCTGSGCIACAIAAHHKATEVIAIDLSPGAAEVAKRNVETLKLSERVTVLQGDLYAPLSGYTDPRPFDVIVANPPYIASEQMQALPRNVKDYEPHLALEGGPDGLDVHRRILAGAPERLLPHGRIFLEIAFDQEESALKMVSEYPAFESPRVLRDYAGQPRVLTAAHKA